MLKEITNFSAPLPEHIRKMKRRVTIQPLEILNITNQVNRLKTYLHMENHNSISELSRSTMNPTPVAGLALTNNLDKQSISELETNLAATNTNQNNLYLNKDLNKSNLSG